MGVGHMAADNIITNIVLDAAMSPPMSEREKALRDLFVREYLQDYDAIGACLRCGFMRAFAEEYAKKFMSEPYVRQQIAIIDSTTPLPNSGNKDADEYNKRRIVQRLFFEAHNMNGTQAARVSALKELAAIHGLTDKVIEDPNKGKKVHRGGIVMVPEIADVTQWEQLATTTQEKLVEDVRS